MGEKMGTKPPPQQPPPPQPPPPQPCTSPDWMKFMPPEVEGACRDIDRLCQALRAFPRPLRQLELMARDEVSIAVSRMFDLHLGEFELLLSEALDFHSRFTVTLTKTGAAYQQAEAAAVAQL